MLSSGISWRSANVNPASACSKIRQAFLTTMAAYLLLTAAIKLLAVALNSRPLQAPDTLLKALTARQVTFAAALLEAIIVCAVVRFRRSSKAPWLLLWLAIVFGLYRVGLWRTCFQGPCPCLGHLLDWSAFLSRLADLVLLCSIGFMGFGSLLLVSYQRGIRKKPGAPKNRGADDDGCKGENR